MRIVNRSAGLWSLVRASVLPALLAAVLGGCSTAPVATASSEVLPEGFTARVVTSHRAVRNGGPIGIDDKFRLDGAMYAWMVLGWTDVDTAWGPQTLEVCWYSGDRLVRRQELALEVTRPPFHVWSRLLPVTIGPGPGRVAFFWHGQLIAAHNFEVVARPESRRSPDV